MRILVWHVDYFRCEITEKGRSPLVEPYENPVTEVEEALIVLTSVEKTDEGREVEVAARAAAEIQRIARQVGATRVVIHSFAHLFAELSAPAAAVETMRQTAKALRDAGLEVVRTPFGWFNTLEIRAKGHPLSRVARIISPS
jgi:sugar phosphate isomerase/epimerase